MFFSLEKQSNESFPHHYLLGDLVLNTDRGWHQWSEPEHIYVFKGYAEGSDLQALLGAIKDNQVLGNFCIFDLDLRDGSIKVVTNQWRGFNIFYMDQERLSNLFTDGYTIWNDSTIETTQSLDLIETKIDIIGQIDPTPLSADKALDIIDARLRTRIKNFLVNNSLPVKVFLSGGIDTMLVWSYIKNLTDDYEMVFGNIIEWDRFWCMNQHRVKSQFWAYQQINHWLDPCVLTSGAPGDEFMLRSPTTANLWLMYHGTSVPEEMGKITNALHAEYFSQHKHRELFDQQRVSDSVRRIISKSREDFHWELCNIVANDCQHWHLGETLTFTPLRDMEIFKTLIRLDLDNAIKQIANSDLSCQLIGRNDPGLLAYISDKKNTGEYLCNLAPLLQM